LADGPSLWRDPVEDPTDAERFLLTTFECLMAHPRDLVSPMEVGLRLELAYDRVLELVEELQAASLLWRTGSRRTLTDARIMITDRGFTALRALHELEVGGR
jgi:hypothetical protein